VRWPVTTISPSGDGADRHDASSSTTSCGLDELAVGSFEARSLVEPDLSCVATHRTRAAASSSNSA